MVLARIKRWLFGTSESESAEAAEEDTTPEGEVAYRCAVCGTDVDDPDGACPLCGSSDVERAGDADPAADKGVESEGDETRVENEGVDPAKRLRETRADLLERHDDAWERDGEGYRVRGPDGEWRRVPDIEAVREVLRGR